MGLLARLFQLVGAGAGVAFEQRVGKGLRQLGAMRLRYLDEAPRQQLAMVRCSRRRGQDGSLLRSVGTG